MREHLYPPQPVIQKTVKKIVNVAPTVLDPEGLEKMNFLINSIDVVFRTKQKVAINNTTNSISDSGDEVMSDLKNLLINGYKCGEIYICIWL